MYELTDEEIDAMFDVAEEAMNNAFYPEEGTKVGAAVLTPDGEMYRGCNVVSVISGMGACAERNAIKTAVAHGDYLFKAMAVSCTKDMSFNPCGMCLQLMNEFAQLNEYNDMHIVMKGRKEQRQGRLRDYITETYGPADKDLDLSRYKN